MDYIFTGVIVLVAYWFGYYVGARLNPETKTKARQGIIPRDLAEDIVITVSAHMDAGGFDAEIGRAVNRNNRRKTP